MQLVLGGRSLFTVNDFTAHYGRDSSECRKMAEFKAQLDLKWNNEMNQIGGSSSKCDVVIEPFCSLVPAPGAGNYCYGVLPLPTLQCFVERIAQKPEDLEHVDNVASDTLANFWAQEEYVLLQMGNNTEALLELKKQLIGVTGTKEQAYELSISTQMNEDGADPESQMKFIAIRRAVGKFLRKKATKEEKASGEEFRLASNTDLDKVLRIRTPAKNVAGLCVSIITGVGVMKRVKFVHLPQTTQERINDLASLVGAKAFDLNDAVSTAADAWQTVIALALDCHPEAWDIAADLAIAIADVEKDENMRKAFLAERDTPTLSGDARPALARNGISGKGAVSTISGADARNVMKVLFNILLNHPIQKLASAYLDLEGFSYLSIFLRNSPTNVHSDATFFWNADAGTMGSFIFSDSLEEIQIKKFCGHLEKLLTGSITQGKEAQFSSKSMLYEVTEENKELLRRHHLLGDQEEQSCKMPK